MTLYRHLNGPIIRPADILPRSPEIVDPSGVFNPGAIRVDSTTVLLLRVQTRGRRTFTVPAHSAAGRKFQLAAGPVDFTGLGRLCEPGAAAPIRPHHIYDPRITDCEGRRLVITAIDTDAGCRLALWEAAGDARLPYGRLERLQALGLTGDRNTRNGVLFPRRIAGRYLLLERPNTPQPDEPAGGDTIVLSESTDLLSWKRVGPVLAGRPRYWDEFVGSGPPPLLTRHGWLHIYHGIATHFRSVNIYQAGAVLLDADDPMRVLGRTRDNLLEPRTTWELTGQVPNVVFPSGLTATAVDDAGCAPDDAEVNLYYGAADTVVGLATATVGDLVAACTP